jgi:hypothetical protein
MLRAIGAAVVTRSRQTRRSLRGIMWVSFAHQRPPGHIMPDHACDGGAVFPALAPHDHLHINHDGDFLRFLQVRGLADA